MGALIRPVTPAPSFRGFTLVELAVVLMIVALLIGGMVMPLAAQQEVRARQDTERQLQEIREALIGFAVLNGRLPRPATSVSDGIENPADCATDAACSGFVPWATLGVIRHDAWGKLLRYSVTPAFANSAGISLSSQPNRTVQGRDNGGTLFYLAGGATCNQPSQCVPAVIYSQGKSRQGTLAEGGLALTDGGSATNLDEDANDVGPTDYRSRGASDASASPGGEFDDLLIWVPSNSLIGRLVAAGKL